MLKKQNFPNIITVLRGVLALVIIILFFTTLPNRFWFIYVLFLLAALSDYLDGYLARKWQVVSDFGKMFDPLFDKILTISLYFLLVSFVGWLLALIFILLLLRELTVDSLKNYLLAKGVITPAIRSAKIKTAIQILMLNFVLLNLIFPDDSDLNILAYLFGAAAVVFAYWSGFIYLKRFIKYFRGNSHEQNF